MMNNPKDSAMYPIGVVEERTGLTGRQIRYYEKMGLISPRRTAGRQRRYTEADINLLLKIKKHIQDGLDIKDIKKILLDLKNENSLAEDPKLSHKPRELEIITDLSSLYPISNRAKLLELIDTKEKRG